MRNKTRAANFRERMTRAEMEHIARMRSASEPKTPTMNPSELADFLGRAWDIGGQRAEKLPRHEQLKMDEEKLLARKLAREALAGKLHAMQSDRLKNVVVQTARERLRSDEQSNLNK